MRGKWKTPVPNITVGSLWQVVTVFPGLEGNVRTEGAWIKVKVYTRPIVHLIILPKIQNDEVCEPCMSCALSREYIWPQMCGCHCASLNWSLPWLHTSSSAVSCLTHLFTTPRVSCFIKCLEWDCIIWGGSTQNLAVVAPHNYPIYFCYLKKSSILSIVRNWPAQIEMITNGKSDKRHTNSAKYNKLFYL